MEPDTLENLVYCLCAILMIEISYVSILAQRIKKLEVNRNDTKQH